MLLMETFSRFIPFTRPGQERFPLFSIKQPSGHADGPFMKALERVRASRSMRLFLNVSYAVVAVVVAVFTARHFASTEWPLAHADLQLVGVSGFLFVLAYAFKAIGWHRLFAPHERPHAIALAAAGGAACVTGAALPGRFDDAVRVAVVRRYPGCSDARVGTLCLSLFMLGLVDTVALMPFASAAAATSDGTAVRWALGVVAFAGIGAAVLMTSLPRLTTSGRLIRYRFVRWASERLTAPRDAWAACALVLASWLVRGLALLVLLGALGIGVSFPIALAFLCGAAASGALPIAPAGAATQAGAGAAILIASGVAATQAVAFAVAAQALLILAGAAVIVFAGVWTGGSRLAVRRLAA
jgi:uncharacterized membrane protein YbhN (UPF0104 family)